MCCEQRYRRLLERLESGTEFSSEEPIDWACRKCGFVVRGKDAPKRCPVCGADSWFAHLAFEVPGKDASTEWLEPVSDEEYNAL